MSVPTAYYFYRLRNDNFIYEFCVANAKDPDQYVESLAPDGTTQRWASHWEGELLVFTAPDGYDPDDLAVGVGWMYDPRLQTGRALPREELERASLRYRHSVTMSRELYLPGEVTAEPSTVAV